MSVGLPDKSLGEGVVRARLEGNVARVTLARDEKRNSINSEVADQFCAIVDRIPDGSVCVLAAEGSMFCAGVDTGAGGGGSEPVERVFDSIQSGRHLWIAEVKGGAAGAGVSMALKCPLVFMSDDAWFWLPELAKLGRVPTSAIRWLTPVIGARSAFTMAATGARVSAASALANGWATGVAHVSDVSSIVDAIAERLSAAAPDSIESSAQFWAMSIAHDRRT